MQLKNTIASRNKMRKPTGPVSRIFEITSKPKDRSLSAWKGSVCKGNMTVQILKSKHNIRKYNNKNQCNIVQN